MEGERQSLWRKSLLKQYEKEEVGLKEEEILLLEVNRSLVECSQLLLESQRIPETARFVLLHLVSGKKRAELENSGGNDDDAEIYQIRRELWLKFPVSGKHRIIRLKSLMRFYPTFLSLSSRSLSLSSSSIIPLSRSSSNNNGNTDIPRKKITIKIKPLSLDLFLLPSSETTTLESLLSYLAILFEYQILENDLKEYGEKKREKLWSLVNRFPNHPITSFLFLASYLFSLGSSLLEKDSLLMLERWKEMEVRFFRRAIQDSPEYREEFMESIFPQHVKEFIQLEGLSTNWQHHQWFQYRIGENYQDFWISGMDSEYHISSHWLMEKDLFSLPFQIKRDSPGQIILSESVFFDKFIPCLYRKMLSDISSFVRFLILAQPPSEYRVVFGELGEERFQLIHSMSQLFRNEDYFPPKNSYQMFLFNSEIAQVYSHPVTRLIGMSSQAANLQQRLKRRIRSSGNSPTNQIFSGGVTPSEVMDIEDLFKKPDQLLPPCLSQLVEHTWKSWCINYDRWYLVRTLLDMGYDREKIFQLMSLNQSERDKLQDLKNMIHSEVKKKAESPWSDLPLCGTIINTIHSSGELIRCPFEAKENKQKRLHSSDLQKEEYRQKCACSIGASSIRHPMDYIRHQLEKEKKKRICL